MGDSLGTFRAAYLVCLCCTGSFLFAYDTGIVGGVLTLRSFQRDFGYTDEQRTRVNSNAVSVLQAGAFFGCFLIWPITSRLGRRPSLMLSSLIFCIGGIIQTLNSHSIYYFYLGRIISGLAVGAATVLIPMYSAEMAPKEIRGQLGACFQLMFALGVTTSYWVDYAVQRGVDEKSSLQWQIPMGLQLIPGAILGIGMLYVKESARWLAMKGRGEDALQSLLWVRGGIQSSAFDDEFLEILTSAKDELREKEGLSFRELLRPLNRHRIFLAIAVHFCAQMTGNSSLAYYAPQIFASVGAGASSLLMTGFFGFAKIVGVLIFQFLLVDRIGRRKPFILGAAIMATLMFCIAIAASKHAPTDVNISVSSSGAVAIILILVEAAVFNGSWGPLPWLYLGEIFSNRMREAGVASGAASQWFFNFIMSQATPYALEKFGWRTFVLFGFLNFAVVGFSVVFLKETKGKALEEMDSVFDTEMGGTDVERERRARHKHRSSGEASRRLMRDD